MVRLRRGLAALWKARRAVLIPASVLLLALVGWAAREPVYHVFHKPDKNGMYPDGTLKRGISGFVAHVTEDKKGVAGLDVLVSPAGSTDESQYRHCTTDKDGWCDIYLTPGEYEESIFAADWNTSQLESKDITVKLDSALWREVDTDWGKVKKEALDAAADKAVYDTEHSGDEQKQNLIDQFGKSGANALMGCPDGFTIDNESNNVTCNPKPVPVYEVPQP